MPKEESPPRDFTAQLRSRGLPGREIFEELVRYSSEIIVVLDEEGTIQYENPATERSLGYPQNSLIGRSLAGLASEEDEEKVRRVLLEARGSSGIPQTALFHLRHQDGSSRLLEVAARHLGRDLGIPALVVNARDITDQQQAEEQILRDTMRDGLTGLANRNLLLDRLGYKIRRRKKEGLFAVQYVGLDRIEIVRESLGLRASDELLVQMARKLERCVRTGDTVGRTGENEFAILLDEIRDVSDASRVAHRIHEQLKMPFSLAGQDVFTTASLGVTLSATGYEQAEVMLRDAELAMHRARDKGGAPYLMFDPAMHDRALARLQLEGDLRRALERGEFLLLYQPIQSLQSGKLTGFEALVRQVHPGRGQISPAEFIPAAEESGLIVPLGQWVLRKACEQLREWQRQNDAARGLVMSVNVSVKQFSQPDFAEGVAQILRETGLQAQELRLEITESMVMDFDAALAILEKLRAVGVHLCIDDFGTGYSSLSYLSRLPIGMLKIDQSFVSRGEERLGNPEVVKSVLALAASFRLGVTAEGIETSEQLAQLRNLACSHGQGYYFGKPLSTEQALMMIRSQPRSMELDAAGSATADPL